MSLEQRFRKFVELNMQVQEELQKSLEQSILTIVPDIPFMDLKGQVKRDMEKTRTILRNWRAKVEREVLLK